MIRLSRVRHAQLRPHRRGIVLLECIIALTILGSALAGMTLLLAECDHATWRAQSTDARNEKADAFMHTVALWTRDDLDRRLGERVQGEWRLIVQRRRPTLYDIALLDRRTRELLVRSSLYRQEPDYAMR